MSVAFRRRVVNNSSDRTKRYEECQKNQIDPSYHTPSERAFKFVYLHEPMTSVDWDWSVRSSLTLLSRDAERQTC